MRCGREAVATVALIYAERAVLLSDLAPGPDIGAGDAVQRVHALYLCGEHVDRMTPPLGWSLRDHRDVARVRA
jgi:Protein of unknown function (DUF3499)